VFCFDDMTFDDGRVSMEMCRRTTLGLDNFFTNPSGDPLFISTSGSDGVLVPRPRALFDDPEEGVLVFPPDGD